MNYENDPNASNTHTSNRLTRLTYRQQIENQERPQKPLETSSFLKKIQYCPEHIRSILKKVFLTSVLDNNEKIALLDCVSTSELGKGSHLNFDTSLYLNNQKNMLYFDEQYEDNLCIKKVYELSSDNKKLIRHYYSRTRNSSLRNRRF